MGGVNSDRVRCRVLLEGRYNVSRPPDPSSDSDDWSGIPTRRGSKFMTTVGETHPNVWGIRTPGTKWIER